ncbi:hypothetical protein [Bartonella sp. AC142YNZD]|uniref:hypothetical protein n=1 Tax=Bartonella sp. AC142YNZD TaxID=3243448 RepID=UPI0035CE9C46
MYIALSSATGKNISVMGPAEAPLALVRGVIVFSFCCFFYFRGNILWIRGQCLAVYSKMLSSILVQIDIDP